MIHCLCWQDRKKLAFPSRKGALIVFQASDGVVAKGRVSLVASVGLEGIKFFFEMDTDQCFLSPFFPTCTHALESLEMFMLLFMTPRVDTNQFLSK